MADSECNKDVGSSFERNQCTLGKEMNEVKSEINEVKSRLGEVTESLKQVVLAQGEVMEKLKVHDQRLDDIQGRVFSSTIVQRERKVSVKGQIFIIGGYDGASNEADKSVEVFNWSTKTWTLIKNCLFLQRRRSYSFIYGKKIMICGGEYTERIEYLNPSESGYTSTVASVSLSSNARHNGLLYKDQILTFHNGVVETSLETPGESRTLLQEEQGRMQFAGVHLFGDNVYILGGQQSKMEKYDVAKNEMKTLPSLPYTVSDMATVAYKDNIIIIGGHGQQPLNDVVMFNVTTQEYKKLPSMLEKRRLCTAVVMGDVIVVMGGNNNIYLNTVEYYVIGDSEWKKLPAMNLARSFATSCVYV